MDFGGFLLWIFGAIFLVALGLGVAILWATRSPHRKIVFGLFISLLALQALFSRHLYQVYWLDEGLFSAAMDGDADRVRDFLDRGADPNMDFEGMSPLQAAKDKEVIEILRRAGAR